jgi:hypothetical protein
MVHSTVDQAPQTRSLFPLVAVERLCARAPTPTLTPTPSKWHSEKTSSSAASLLRTSRFVCRSTRAGVSGVCIMQRMLTAVLFGLHRRGDSDCDRRRHDLRGRDFVRAAAWRSRCRTSGHGSRCAPILRARKHRSPLRDLRSSGRSPTSSESSMNSYSVAPRRRARDT